jgi:hypothetical protein
MRRPGPALDPRTTGRTMPGRRPMASPAGNRKECRFARRADGTGCAPRPFSAVTGLMIRLVAHPDQHPPRNAGGRLRSERRNGHQISRKVEAASDVGLLRARTSLVSTAGRDMPLTAHPSLVSTAGRDMPPTAHPSLPHFRDLHLLGPAHLSLGITAHPRGGLITPHPRVPIPAHAGMPVMALPSLMLATHPRELRTALHRLMLAPSTPRKW